MINNPEKITTSVLYRIGKYTLARAATLFVTIVISVYLTIMIVNLGGYLDTIIKASISDNINGMLMNGWLKGKPQEERQAAIQETRWVMEEAQGLHQAFALRCARWLYNGITLQWGQARYGYVILKGIQSKDLLSNNISTLILSYLPRTLLISGVTNFALFFISIAVALSIARKPGGWFDKLMVALAPLSAIPGWAYGILLYAFFFQILGIYSFKLGYNEWPTTFTPQYLPILLKSLCLPFLAIFLSKIFQMVYAWRAFFLIYRNENYVELAKAKGLPNAMLERRYILQPALPSLITGFALIPISIWQECIAVEYFFKVNGIGWFFLQALHRFDIAPIVALVVVFAYLLAFTVFIVDIIYAIVDPRVRVGKEPRAEKPVGSKSNIFRFPGLFQKRQLPASYDIPTRPNHNNASPRQEPVTKQPLALLHRTAYDLPTQPIYRKASRKKNPLSSLSQVRSFCLSWINPGYSLLKIARNPYAVVGGGLLLAFSIIPIYTLSVFPYDKAISMWRGDDKAWVRNPIDVPPAWTNWFRKDKLPENIELDSSDRSVQKMITGGSKGTTEVTLSFPFDFPYDSYPQDIVVFFQPQYKVKKPFVSLTWITPDGREIGLKNFTITEDSWYLFSKDQQLERKLRGIIPAKALFTKPDTTPAQVLKGRYQLRVKGLMFEADNDIEAQLVVYGQVYGLAGTDISRRDLSLILLWGTTVALSFGILAAISTMFLSVVIAASSAWYGGWLDDLIQRITEINMVLPVLPTSLMIFILFSKSFWAILGVTVALSIFGNAIKNYRAMFLQVKELPYIQAAQTYGASDWRIIFRYMIPKIRTALIPQFIILVPSYVFYEATLAYLGVIDPVLPTLGKFLVETLNLGVFSNSPHLILGPLGLLFLISFAFSLLGSAMERRYNEKLGI